MSTGTRAARAASSRQVKQELTRLLFGKNRNTSGLAEASNKLDPTAYSYGDLKKAYLQRIHELHPDKNTTSNLDAAVKEAAKEEFRKLKDAWDRYEMLAKAMNKVHQNGEESSLSAEANFTMFGVGCSFSDNEEERELRNEIMDQACRGWFSAGSLTASTDDDDANGRSDSFRRPKTPLIDNDLFEEIGSNDVASSSGNNPNNKSNNNTSKTTKTSRTTLIPGLNINRR